MNWKRPLGMTWTYITGSLSAAYTVAAGAWAALPGAWVPTLSEGQRWVLATTGVVLAVSVLLAHKIESRMKAPAPPASNDFHQGGA